jgi:hypothetical protein
MKEEKLVEVARDWDTYPKGSICEIKANGELWIANEKTHVTISKATQDEMKNLKLWGQRMKIERDGYVLSLVAILSNFIISWLNQGKIVTSMIYSTPAGLAKKKISLCYT